MPCACYVSFKIIQASAKSRAVARTLVGGGGRAGGVYSYLHFLHKEFLFKSNSNCQFHFEVDLKRDLSGRTWIYEFTPPPSPPPPINVVAKALSTSNRKIPQEGEKQCKLYK